MNLKPKVYEMQIGETKIQNFSPYFIAEIGNNHNGDFDLAIRMIDKAVEAGADAVKFQMRTIDEVYRSQSLESKGEDLSVEYLLDLLGRFELSKSEHLRLAKYCEHKGTPYLCTPWDKTSLAYLESLNVPAYKIASADLTNIHFIQEVIKTGKPIILSTGMSSTSEIQQTVEILKDRGAPFCLLHCNSTYPAPAQDINLNYMMELNKMHRLVGYSGHERGIYISIAAIAMGAAVIERHVTMDRNMEGPDHAASLTFEEFKQLVDAGKEIKVAMGKSGDRQISQGEMINRENLGKSILAAYDLDKGKILTEDDFIIKSPGRGLSPQRMPEFVGKRLLSSVDKDEFLFLSHIQKNTEFHLDFEFKLDWGIPVRYHDFRQFEELISPDIWEFHFSFNDLTISPHDVFKTKSPARLVVHAPELFSNSHLLDLTSTDNEYRQISISHMQTMINTTRVLAEYFRSPEKVPIVTNVGGFSMDEPLCEMEIERRYENLEKSLIALDCSDIEILPQTMAPFPWHFGGQRFQNLFLNADDIRQRCSDLHLAICLDVSHSFLWCNHSKEPFDLFVKKVSEITKHLHIGDAKGLNGEGLQLGDGEIDFDWLTQELSENFLHCSFIPEIWQGHKDQGAGFWKALKKLEGRM